MIHLAAYYDFSGAPSPLYQQLTVEGTRRLIEELQHFDVEQFVFSSSLLVMKPAADEEPLTEKSPTQGEWAYPKSKLAAEQVIRQSHGDIPSVVLRIAGVYTDEGNSIPLSQQISRIYERNFESHLFPGESEHGEPFVHLDDLVQCIQQVIERRHTLGQYEVFLIAEDELMSYQQLQDRIGRLIHGETCFTLPIPKSVAKAGAWAKNAVSSDEEFIKPWMIDLADDHYPVDISRAREQLGWRPRHRLYESLPAIVDHLATDPKGWYAMHELGEPPPEKLGHVMVDPYGARGPSASQSPRED